MHCERDLFRPMCARQHHRQGHLFDQAAATDADSDLRCEVCGQRLNAAGADLAVIQENVNTRSPMGRFIFTLFSALAQLERAQIAERTSVAMLRHQAQGRRMTRPDRCPFGWRPDPANADKLVEDDGEQTAITRIRVERKKGKGLRAIARALGLSGIDCRGRRWSHSIVRSILHRQTRFAEASELAKRKPCRATQSELPRTTDAPRELPVARENRAMGLFGALGGATSAQ